METLCWGPEWDPLVGALCRGLLVGALVEALWLWALWWGGG